MHVPHFIDQVIRPTLRCLEEGQPGLYSEAAVELLAGTAAQESGFEYLVQLGGGPALGVYQIEPATHLDQWETFLAVGRTRRRLASEVEKLMARAPHPNEQLVTNLAYATAIARIKYWRAPEPLPERGDAGGHAKYWKQHYNTPLGAGTESAFIAAFERLVRPHLDH